MRDYSASFYWNDPFEAGLAELYGRKFVQLCRLSKSRNPYNFRMETSSQSSKIITATANISSPSCHVHHDSANYSGDAARTPLMVSDQMEQGNCMSFINISIDKLKLLTIYFIENSFLLNELFNTESLENYIYDQLGCIVRNILQVEKSEEKILSNYTNFTYDDFFTDLIIGTDRINICKFEIGIIKLKVNY